MEKTRREAISNGGKAQKGQLNKEERERRAKFGKDSRADI